MTRNVLTVSDFSMNDDDDMDDYAGGPTAKRELTFDLNEDQQAAEDAIFAAYDRGERRFLLIGAAGVGKTFLMQSVCYKFSQRKLKSTGRPVRVAATAPTHKAVAVIGKKLDEAGLDYIDRMTIHSLLGLKPSNNDSEKQVLKCNPNGRSKAGDYDVVVLDEGSMCGADLDTYIDKDLTFHFVLYVGDDAQLPPVGEDIAPCFKKIKPECTFRLTKIVRQAEGNPILKAAAILREQQGTEKMDWSWLAPAVNAAGDQGIYQCGADVDAWLHDAFKSDEFRKNNDAYRCVAYTNARVKEINAKIRRWIYGETDTPFVVGERLVCRNPILNSLQVPIFATNEEAIVTSIEASEKEFAFGALSAAAGQQAFAEWRHPLRAWKVGLRRADARYGDDEENGTIVEAYMPMDENEYYNLERTVAGQAKANRNRWREFFDMKEQVADLRPVYALTAHSAQGSTFGVVFCDVPDLAKRTRTNLLEAQKLMYVAVTRASKGVVLMGI